MRPHVAAVYAFARVADDFADEGAVPGPDRRARLAAWQSRLHRAAASAEPGESATTEDLIFVALGHSIRALKLPVPLFDDLLSAFGQDTMTSRYASWRDLLDYCRRSANPIGRLVLRIAGYDDDRLDRSSDALCTALQLTNFWQDFGRDWRAGRVYLPQEVQRACGAAEADLASGRLTPPWSAAIARAAAFTRPLFDEGRLVCDGVRGRLAIDLRLTWLGGARILERVEQRRGELLHDRPALGVGDAPVLVWRAVRWTRVQP